MTIYEASPNQSLTWSRLEDFLGKIFINNVSLKILYTKML